MLCRTLSINFWKKNISEDIFGKINKKILLNLVDFDHKGLGLGGGMNLLKIANLGRKFCSDNVEC